MGDTGASEIEKLREHLDKRFDKQDVELQQIRVTVGGIKMETAALVDTVAEMNRREDA